MNLLKGGNRFIPSNFTVIYSIETSFLEEHNGKHTNVWQKDRGCSF